MEHKNDILLTASMFLTWLCTITQSQIIGCLTVVVLLFTIYNKYLNTKKLKAEIKRLERNN